MAKKAETAEIPTEKSTYSEDKVKIRIPKIPGQKQQDDVVLTINGRSIQIQRGHDVEIPADFAALYNNSVAAEEEAEITRYGNM